MHANQSVVSLDCSQRPAMPVVRVGARAASSEGRTCRLGPTRTSPLARGPARSHSEEHEQWSRRHPLPSTHTVGEVLWVTRHGLARASFPGSNEIADRLMEDVPNKDPRSPARCSRARVTTSRRFVLTRSPDASGSEPAPPPCNHARVPAPADKSPYPVGPASKQTCSRS